jgi:hypothetical protein
MEDLFYRFWWLLFPLAWFISAGFSSILNYRRQRDTLDLLRRYADKGQEPPAELLQSLNRVDDMEAANWGGSSRGDRRHSWPWPANVAMFTVLAAGFGYAAWTDIYGVGEAFQIVTFVMVALAVAFLIGGLFSGRPRA